MLAEKIQQIPYLKYRQMKSGRSYKRRKATSGTMNAMRKQIGDAYTFIALERSTKLVLAWHLGKRDTPNTIEFVRKVRAATF